MIVKDILNIQDLLKRFPNGFSVSKSGKIYEIVYSTQSLAELSRILPTPPKQGGYMVARTPELQNGDIKIFMEEPISTQDYYKYYADQTFEDEDEAQKVIDFLNNKGIVGRTVKPEKSNGRWKLILE